MKLKEQKKLGMLYFVLGAVLAIAGYFIKSSWLASFGGGVCVLGLVRLLRAAASWMVQPAAFPIVHVSPDWSFASSSRSRS